MILTETKEPPSPSAHIANAHILHWSDQVTPLVCEGCGAKWTEKHDGWQPTPEGVFCGACMSKRSDQT